MAWSFPIGRFLGSELRVHATFFLLILWIGAAAWFTGGWPAAIGNVAFIAALFACVVAHEYGHALMARRYGIATPDITLLPIGGLARLERMPEKPSQEIAVALAGPAVNVVIWLVLVILLGAESRVQTLGQIENPTADFLGRLAAVNLFLVVFNLLPAFPMDGGRVFRALLSMRLDRVRATRIAAGAGQVLAFIFGFLGLTGGNPLLVLIGVFVFLAASAESSDVAMRSAARQLQARDAMITSFETLTEGDTLHAAAQALIRTTQHEFPVMDESGTLTGFLTRKALFRALAEDQRHGPIAPILTRDIPRVRLNVSLTQAIDAMHKASAPAVAVTDHGGTFLGYITAENIGEVMVISGR